MPPAATEIGRSAGDCHHWLVSRETRRATFDEDAELYDRARHGYPAELLDDLANLAGIQAGTRVLEIGPGTGQATRSLVDRGAEVVAVELGASLAALLQRNLPTVKVILADFDTWSVPESAFDAVAGFTAWHWLDPATRAVRAATALRPGGSLATVTTVHVAGGTETFFDAAQLCYERWDPETPPGGVRPPRADDVPLAYDEVDDSPLFEPAERRRIQTSRTYRTGEYVDALRTYSGHRVLEPQRRKLLLDCIAALIDADYGGQVTKRYLYELRVARRR